MFVAFIPCAKKCLQTDSPWGTSSPGEVTSGLLTPPSSRPPGPPESERFSTFGSKSLGDCHGLPLLSQQVLSGNACAGKKDPWPFRCMIIVSAETAASDSLNSNIWFRPIKSRGWVGVRGTCPQGSPVQKCSPGYSSYMGN